MDFVMSFPLLLDQKGDNYDSILVIIDCLTKIVYYKPVKKTIEIVGLIKVIIDVVVRYHNLPKYIISDRGSLFISKFWFLLSYFLSIKQKLSTAFHPHRDGWTQRQNSIMKIYLRTFINQKQNNRARLLPMTEFAYNNVKNTSTDHTSFELKCGYYSRNCFKDKINSCSKYYSANKLAHELKDQIAIYQQNQFPAQEF